MCELLYYIPCRRQKILIRKHGNHKALSTQLPIYDVISAQSNWMTTISHFCPFTFSSKTYSFHCPLYARHWDKHLGWNDKLDRYALCLNGAYSDREEGRQGTQMATTACISGEQLRRPLGECQTWILPLTPKDTPQRGCGGAPLSTVCTVP